jgi:hypothetical protein
MMEDGLEKKIKYACISASVTEFINKRLFGEIMTIVDASVSDTQSRKATKSLVSQSFTRVTRQFLTELNNLKEG